MSTPTTRGNEAAEWIDLLCEVYVSPGLSRPARRVAKSALAATRRATIAEIREQLDNPPEEACAEDPRYVSSEWVDAILDTLERAAQEDTDAG